MQKTCESGADCVCREFGKKKGVPPIILGEAPFPHTHEEIQKRINSVPLFGSFDLYSGSAKELIAELESREVMIEKEARKELMESLFSIADVHKTGHRFAVDLVEVTAVTLGLEESSPYMEIFTVATFYGLMPCVNYSAPCVALSYAINGKVPKNPYVVFATQPLSQKDPIFFTLEVKSRTWGGVTLGAVNGAPDFVAPGRKYIFAKRYRRL